MTVFDQNPQAGRRFVSVVTNRRESGLPNQNRIPVLRCQGQSPEGIFDEIGNSITIMVFIKLQIASMGLRPRGKRQAVAPPGLPFTPTLARQLDGTE